MAVWISGAGGFLGNALAAHLADEGIKVIAMTSDPVRLRERLSGHKNVKAVPRDALFQVEATSCDVLVNCAYPRDQEAAALASGFDYTFALFRAARNAGMPVINISSQSIYSRKRERAAGEETPAVLESSYAVGKYMAELLADAELRDIPHTNIRMASLIGPGFDQRIPNRLIDQVLAGKELSVREDHQLFGFLDVEDAVRGITALLKTDPATWRRIYNLGGTEGCTLKDIAENVRDVMNEDYGYDVKITYVPDETYTNTTIDSSLLAADCGYEPSVPLKTSIRRIAAQKVKAL